MAYTKRNSSDLVVCANHPKYSDTKNSACIELYTLLEVEHTDGIHDERIRSLAGEILTFTGDGNSSKTITLSSSDLVPKYALCWESGLGNIITNPDFSSDISDWTVTDCSAASVAGGQSGNCCQITNSSTNLLTNAGWPSDTSDWTLTSSGASISSVAGGQSGNCLQINDTDGIAPKQVKQTISYLHGAKYTLSWYVKHGTKTAGNAWVYMPYSAVTGNASATTSSSWTNYTCTFTSNGTAGQFALADNHNGQTGTVLFDTFSMPLIGYLSQDITTVPGRTYFFSLYVKSGTSGDQSFAYGHDSTILQTGTSSGSWVQYSQTFVASGTTTTVWFRKNKNTAGTMLFDTIDVHEVISTPGVFRLDTFDDNYSAKGKADVTLATGLITNFDTGEIEVSATGAEINTNGRTNYCLILGIIDASTTYAYTGGANDPDWVEDAELGSADGTGTSICDKVEEHINTAFEAEHNGSTGIHTTDPYDKGKIETGTWTGTNGDDIVTLENPDLDIKYGFYFKSGGSLYSVSESMPSGDSKDEDVAAFSTNGFQSIGTGTFTAKTTDTSTYHYCVIGE